jgi:EAL domain-containing protein (putative c-di-GMP-specific phosphodiesterase class I)
MTVSAGTAAKVLVVDDDPLQLRGYRRILASAGYAVETEPSAPHAVQMAAKESFDVIISDITMPEIDGLQLLRAVREHDLLVPVVLMTGAPMVETAAKAVELGALRYLFKPIKPEELTEVVGYAVRMHRLAHLREQALRASQQSTQAGDLAGLEASFARALDSLWMAFQPIVTWRGREIHAYEALVRSGESSLPHPGALFDAAERLDRLHELGRVIRDRVATAAPRLDSDKLLFVNLHPRDLLDDELYRPSAALSRIAGRVVLEITERTPLAGMGDLRGRLQSLRDLGYRFALDDLGAGYAGLSGFTVLDPAVVKLDISLVRNVHLESTKLSVIKAMVNLCQELNITVVSEGIETAEERDALVAVGCDLLQGFLFARPAPEFVRLEL